MARVNLRAAFMTGLDSPVTAQEVFTDRVDEIAAFARARQNLDDALAAADVSPVVDRAVARRNVLTFYGVGGIGKTALSQELERRMVAEMHDAKRSDVVCVRMDLSDDGMGDVENIVLRLRAGLGQLGARWQAFDLALSCYWARAHPGESLQEFLDSSPIVRRAAGSVNLGQQIAANLEPFVPSDFVGLPGMAQRAGMHVYRAVRDRVRRGRLLADCELFEELVETEADRETLSFFPYLLAWDLDRLARRDRPRPTVCVFIDTFEAAQGRGDASVERHVNRCIYLMPNVLFVLTGRNRIDWADRQPGSELDFAGRERWPNLHFSNHTDEPRQHLVGYLSDSDADSYLRDALTDDDGPAMPVEVRHTIVGGARGLPLYLDLSVSHFLEQLAQGRSPRADDFGGSFTAVATRSLRDLDRPERELVRTTSLIERFDGGLLRTATPGVSDGQVGRFLRRPFLMRDDAHDLPYTLHQTLREAIEEGDDLMADGWSVRDRSDAAGRLLAALGARIGPQTGRAATTQTLEAGLRLAISRGVHDDWLIEATQSLVEAGQWSVIAGWLPSAAPQSSYLQALVTTIEAVELRRAGDPGRAATLLQATGGELEPDSKLGRFLRLHHAHSLRNLGDYRGAADLYRGLVGSELDLVARYWLCDHDYLKGRFPAAYTEVSSWRGRTPAEEGERLRLAGHIARVNGRFAEAAATYGQAVELARSEGLTAAEAKALTNLAQTRCWDSGISTVADLVAEAVDLLDLVPNRVELVKLRAAEAVAAAMDDDREAAVAAIDATRRTADEIGYTGGHNLADLATIFLAVQQGDYERAQPTVVELASRTRASGGNTYWVPITAAWIERAMGPDRPPSWPSEMAWPDIEWLDGEEATLRRWVGVLTG